VFHQVNLAQGILYGAACDPSSMVATYPETCQAANWAMPFRLLEAA
jgi:hypothetical protein